MRWLTVRETSYSPGVRSDTAFLPSVTLELAGVRRKRGMASIAVTLLSSSFSKGARIIDWKPCRGKIDVVGHQALVEAQPRLGFVS